MGGVRQTIFCLTESDLSILQTWLGYLLVTFRMSLKTQNEKELEEKAVEEIMKETTRAAARAEVGGTLSWRKPKHKGINKRFLNNTMLSTMIQNKKSPKQGMTMTMSTTIPLTHHIRTSADKIMKRAPEIANHNQPPDSLSQAPKTSGPSTNKVVLSSKGRYKAYLASYRKQKVDIEKTKNMEEANNETEVNSNQNT